MRLRTVIFLLIAAGIAGSLGVSIYAAQPWGGNYAYQNLGDYLELLAWEAFITLPFLLLFLVARRYATPGPQMMFLVFGCLVMSGFGVYTYIDAVFVNPSSTAALIFLVLPIYQLIFVAIIWGVCAVVRRRAARDGAVVQREA